MGAFDDPNAPDLYSGLPTVNVKVYHGPTREQLEEIEREQGATGFADWYKSEADQHGPWYDLQQLAQESALEDAQNDAERIFGKGVEVSLEGRSGGHLCVKRLPEQDITAGEWCGDEENPERLEWERPRTDWPEVSTGWNIDEGEEKITLTPSDTLAHRWGYFAACAKANVEDFPRRVADLICANVYIPMMEEKAAKDADKAERAEIADKLRALAQTLGTDEEEYTLNRAAELIEQERN